MKIPAAVSAVSVRSLHSRQVLAGAYRGKDVEDRTLLSHYYDVTDGHWGAKKTLCNRIVADRLSDLAETTPASCPECARRFELRANAGLVAWIADADSPAGDA